MSNLTAALELAARGFHIFPVRPNEKLPLIKDFPNRATTDPDRITKWFANYPTRNVAISTSHFKDDQHLVVIDVDTKAGKRGFESLLKLELQGFTLPETAEHETPSGGRHLVYTCDSPLRQGVDVLGEGLDVRATGGYIVGPGSEIEGGSYEIVDARCPTPAPAWLIDRLGRDAASGVAVPADRTPLVGVNPDRAADRAIAYLLTAPLAVEGEAGDQRTFLVAAKCKDCGCDKLTTFELMSEHWNPRCEPPWEESELAAKVDHAYRYGREAQGCDAPEAIFPVVAPTKGEALTAKQHPFAALNKEFAFIRKGCFVLQETTDVKGNFTTEHLGMAEFHGWFANKPFQAGKDRPKPISEHWMSWANRREYEGVVFSPEKDAGPRWYNLWRGFRVAPEDKAKHPALAAFLEHALKNVCGGNKELFNWLIGYFAHMIQKPWEKPLVALVMKGKKGTGKNALLERVGWLLGAHFLVADDDRYLLSNFNAHLEANLFFILDEAAWAGDKKAEGRLKGLITGTEHNIERKGAEPYRVTNLTRVAIIGNEDWLVPASQDERRFAVFHVNEGRMQDRKFFQDMREGMEQGGYAHLLRYLLDFDLSQVDVNDAPNTQALVDQKIASLPPIQQWWYDCLHSGQIAGGDFGGEWPEAIPTNRLREAYFRWARTRNIRGRLEEEVGFGRAIKHFAPSFRKKKTRPTEITDRSYSFLSPGVEQLRKDWEKFLGGNIEWEV